MDGLEAEWGSEVQVVRLNIHQDDVETLLQRLDFRFTPTFILFDARGQETWRTVGSLSPEVANQQINALP